MTALSNPEAAKRIEAVCDDVLINATIEEKRDKFVETGPMVIYGNFYDKKVSLDEGFKNFIFSDIPTIGYLSSENCPFMGFMGAKYLVEGLVNEVYMGIFLETKGEMMGPISSGVVAWDMPAEQAMIKVGEMIPHFVRATALKKLHQEAEKIAQERGTNVTHCHLPRSVRQVHPDQVQGQILAGVRGRRCSRTCCRGRRRGSADRQPDLHPAVG